MAAKQIPVIGEAFLGSDPMADRILRVSFGDSESTLVPDVVLTTAGAQDLVTFGDSGYIITKMVLNIVEAFSVAAIAIGQDSLYDAFFADTLAGSAVVTSAVGVFDPRWDTDTDGGQVGKAWGEKGLGAATAGDSDALAPWPVDSDDSIQVSYSGAATLGTEGHGELYVFYHKLGANPA